MSAQRASSHHGTTVHAEAVATREDHWENGVGVIGSPTDSASEVLHSITARYGGGIVVVIEMLGRLNLYNMAIQQCWIKDSPQAGQLVDYFNETLERLSASGLVDPGREQLEATIKGDVEMDAYTPTVIVQVLDSLALKVDDWRKAENREDRFLHEIAVMVWETDLRIEQLTWEREVVVRRRYCSRLLVVLDRPFLVAALHAFKGGHLAIVMSIMEFYKMMEDTKALERSIDDSLAFGANVWLGMTVQQRTQNMQNDDLRWLIRTSLYDSVDGLTVRLSPIAAVDSMSPFLKQGWWAGAPLLLDFNQELALHGLSRYVNQTGPRDDDLDTIDS